MGGKGGKKGKTSTMIKIKLKKKKGYQKHLAHTISNGVMGTVLQDPNSLSTILTLKML